MISKFSAIYLTLSAMIVVVGVAVHANTQDSLTGVAPWGLPGSDVSIGD